MKRVSHTLLLLFILINILYINVSASEAAGFSDNKNAVVPDTSEQDKSQQESVANVGEAGEWVKINSKTYFFKDGKKQKGWQKIKGEHYYFNKKGVLQKNKIAGNKKIGYCYVDLDGIRVTDEVIQYAVKFVRKNSSSKDSSKKRLESCYKKLCSFHYRRLNSEKPSAKKIESYAFYMFENKQGDCYRYASALAYIARVLGYDSRLSFDNTITMHGWCEIKINGKWKVCDCTMQMTNRDTNFFLVDKKKFSSLVRLKWGTGLKWDSTYTIRVKKGKISWK